MPYSHIIINVPDVALLFDGCRKDWRRFPGSEGTPQGYLDPAKNLVMVRQERCKPCKKRCNPGVGVKTTIGGVEYKVDSRQDGHFRGRVKSV